jgi:hypothetical protein
MEQKAVSIVMDRVHVFIRATVPATMGAAAEVPPNLPE